MIRGIYVNQTALNTTGHNIVNADTEGYSRQSVNVITTKSEGRSSVYGNLSVGTGAEVQSVTRSRDIFADVQYRDEKSTAKYYETLATNYDKLEVIFDDAEGDGLQSRILDFYQAWVGLSTESSNASNRVNAIEKGKNLADAILTATEQLQEQINYNYYYMNMNLKEVDDILSDITKANKLIVAFEANGASANDLRDNRDLLIDRLSEYMPVKIYEDQYGNYQVTSGGTTLVNGVDRLHLVSSRGIESKYFGEDYGVADYSIAVQESSVVFVPHNGVLQANLDAVDQCKKLLDSMANLAGFLLTTFNDQHRQGYDLYGEQKGLTDMFEVTNPANGKKYYEKHTWCYTAAGSAGGNFDTDTKADGTVYYKRVEDGTGAYTTTHVNVDDLRSYADSDIVKVASTINFYGEGNGVYKYGYDEDWNTNVVYVWREDGTYEKLSGAGIVAELKVADQFNTNEGYMHVAAATAYTNESDYSSVSSVDGEQVVDSDTYYSRLVDWGERTGDGTNAVFLSELFNLSRETIMTAGRSNAFFVNRYAKDYKNQLNSIGGQSINSFYISEVTQLAVDTASTDTRIEQQDSIMTQIQNWRSAASGVDWNEELTNMLKYQKGFIACSRCLNTMNECLDSLVNIM